MDLWGNTCGIEGAEIQEYGGKSDRRGWDVEGVSCCAKSLGEGGAQLQFFIITTTTSSLHIKSTLLLNVF